MELSALKTTSKRIDILHAMNIYSMEDIIYHFPYRYDIIEESYDNEHMIIEATVISQPKVFFRGKMSRMSFEVIDRYGNHYQVAIFNRHYLRTHLSLSTTITILGKCQNNKITASDIKMKPLCDIAGIHPVYSLKDGINQKSFSQYVKKAYQLLKSELVTLVPEEYIIKHHLVHKDIAIYNIHFPDTQEDIKQSLKYLKYEEFLQFQLTMQLTKFNRYQENGTAKNIDLDKLQNFIMNLPFQLTHDQSVAVKEIVSDLQKPQMMYRFLQGDVGSGKTVVGAIALYATYLAGYQGALMAPTEILALQHYKTLSKFFEKTDIHMALLTGSLSMKEKNEIYEKLNNGDIHIVVGTHALFQKKVNYKHLGFVITDEQHRFGVEQRKALKNKGQQVDFLIMSATPIPRTLAIALYGDMDVSTIKTKPAGRQEVETKYIEASSMKPILKHLKAYLASGGQCYVICPLVDESEKLEVRSATQIYEAMSSYFKGQYKVGLLHGQLKDDEKDDIMQQFVDNQIQILVSTTVVEVGVDVKNANMMIIYNAERFGMSQLHQLRGRIGRGSQKAYCYLMSDQASDEAKERLHYLETCQDGFDISMYDLKVRGPGEVLGEKQSGLPSFLVGDVLKDYNILSVAKDDATQMINAYQNHRLYAHTIEGIVEKLKENNEYVD
ncbi:MAG: ATP-dependent DNA helicase RecG [Erysipelotrichaceae bacterium]|nr:ATP-dependent DNA helicase RecG [Erysipelotrichaceae bacterium]